jgi:hypothetical protein
LWAGIILINPDAFIAKENIERLTQGKKLDLYYLNNLSIDAIPEIVKIFKTDASDGTKMEVARDLYYNYNLFSWPRQYDLYGNNSISFKEKIENAEKRQNENWQSFNFSQKKALKSLRENYKEIVKYQVRYFQKEAERCYEEIKNCGGDWGCGSKEMCEVYEKNAKMEE